MALQNPGFIATRESYSNELMTAFRCGGHKAVPISVRGRSPRINRQDWQDAAIIVDGRDYGALRSRFKRLLAAAQHAAIVDRLRHKDIGVLYAWRAMVGRRELALRAARSIGIPCVHFERGPLPGWVQIDLQGVNAGSSIPRDPAFFRAWRAAAGPLPDWRALKATLVARPAGLGLAAQDRRADWSGEGPFLFCPFQLNEPGLTLPDGGWVSAPRALVEALAAASRALPAGWHLRVKPHPTARGDLGRVIGPYLSDRLRIDRDTNSLDQLGASRGVITVNSAMGLEAFFHDKPVIVLGDSYYSDFGRTEVATSASALADLIAQPDALGFDQGARDDLMDFLFNDFFIPEEAVRSGAFTFETLSDRHARHRAILDSGGAGTRMHAAGPAPGIAR